MSKARCSMARLTLVSIGCWLVSAAQVVWAADGLLAKVQVDKVVTRSLRRSGSFAPIRVALVVQNPTDEYQEVALSRTLLFRLHQATNLGPDPTHLPVVAEGELQATYGQFWTSISLEPHSEDVVAVGTLPSDITIVNSPATDIDQSVQGGIPPGTYLLSVNLPPGLKAPGASFPGWSDVMVVIAE